jgi:alanine-glyoxylate transaminase/serine-glyoxylate transaminase/serine-pyruvate transaminase
MKTVFGTKSEVFIFPSSGTGCWEAALVNTLSPGDAILIFDQGFFSSGWQQVATRLGLEVHMLPGDWRRGADAEKLHAKLSEDRDHVYKAVIAIHNETSTGVTSDIAAIGDVLRDTGHPALLMVDSVSSLACVEYRHDDWRVDVTVSGSQKGLMLPPGLGFTAVSEGALAATASAKLPRSYWDWQQMLTFNDNGFFPYTPATNMLFGLREALAMFAEEGWPNVFKRHQRLSEATRRAVEAWGLEVYATHPEERSRTVTAVCMPDGVSVHDFRRTVLDRFNMSLGGGLGGLKDSVFRIGHMGYLNEIMLAGALCGVEMGLRCLDVPLKDAGVTAALSYLTEPDE